MTTLPPRANVSQAGELPQTLIDRVQARVADARLALDQRAGDARSKSHRRRRVPKNSQGLDETREAESLRRVFRDLGVSYRRYRRQTGEPVSPALRDAAYGFRAEPSLSSLVAVAVFLDELDLLT
jgi:hypothetical protein